ncbi:MAG TPA: hypothetical protein VE127_14490 [Solirubrobacteraceae bacterium]|nr:hypothetical protein [Solirubrobacteraceae bacterium]
MRAQVAVLAEAMDDCRDGSGRDTDRIRDLAGCLALAPEPHDRAVEAVGVVALSATPAGHSGTGQLPGLPGSASEQERGWDFQSASQTQQSVDRRLADASLDQRQTGLAETGGAGQLRLRQMAAFAGGADVLPEYRRRLQATADRIARRRRIEGVPVGGHDEEEAGEPF